MLKLPREPNTAGDVCPLRLSVSFQAPDTRPAATDIVKGFGRFSVRKPLMEEPAWALGPSYGDLCFGVIGGAPRAACADYG